MQDFGRIRTVCMRCALHFDMCVGFLLQAPHRPVEGSSDHAGQQNLCSSHAAFTKKNKIPEKNKFPKFLELYLKILFDMYKLSSVNTKSMVQTEKHSQKQVFFDYDFGFHLWFCQQSLFCTC